ncbi:MAG: MBL fold metallo-hydrolase [Puniceicoccales bacterium]|jgi:phosphoribosyl 1,2-cyclic phosphate phosphodiesterase|nr:MBL fold metallo-hydrolase [Puniceicoccales bacterium]
MEIIFMGTGTSQGVPLIAHPNPGLDLGNPKNWRTRASIHVVIDESHVQVDAGPDFRQQCWQNNIPAVDTFILTHGHADHVVGMDDLRRYCDLRAGSAIPVYSTEEGLGRVRQIYPYALHDRPISSGYVAFSLHDMPAVMTFAKGSEIRTTLLPHGRVETLGLVFWDKHSGKKFVYYSDCNDVPKEAMALAMDADVAVLDGLRPQPHPTHMSVEKAIEISRQMRARETFITHTTWQLDYDTWTPILAKDNVKMAYDGLRLVL